ncbi:MAG: thioredoxin family protein [Verrucomicrobiae bacterium]|jgi:thioredoxin-related protein|nr:thioredoxin family protein [Verrucomicrobiae bacterium]
MKTKHTLAAFVALMIAALPALAAPKWYTDLDEAKAVAVKENKPLLVDFTGSDWCGYCIKLHAEVFDKPEFEAFAKNYVLVELDFPSKKPQPAEEKAKNKATQTKFGVSGFPTVLLIDAKSGEAYGRQSGYGPGTGPKAYIEKLSAFKNTAEGRAALVAESKKASEASAKRAAQGAKVRAAIEAKDFDAVCKLLDEDFADAQGSRKAVASINKALMSQRIDPANKERALKWADQAVAESAGDEKMQASIKQMRDRMAAGTNLSQPVPVKPATEAKKADKGA